MPENKKEIKLAKYAGFCYGVKRAVETVKKLKNENPDKKVFVLGELIHNTQVIHELESLGIKTLTEIPEKGEGIFGGVLRDRVRHQAHHSLSRQGGRGVYARVRAPGRKGVRQAGGEEGQFHKGAQSLRAVQRRGGDGRHLPHLRHGRGGHLGRQGGARSGRFGLGRERADGGRRRRAQSALRHRGQRH